MTFLLIALFIIGVVELLTSYLPYNNFQKAVALIVGCLTLGISLSLVVLSFSAWTLLLGFFSIFRAINLLRLIDGRKQLVYLRSVYIRTSQSLLSYQLVVLLVAYLARGIGLSFQAKWIFIVALQLIVSVIVFLSLRRSLIKTRPLQLDEHISDRDLPSITVAIPARNETSDLEDCLVSLTSSNYPKLEILVLDDCSQNKHTPEIIRQFAHDGVRFLAGKLPPEAWSAKNYAYQQLAEAANGKIILFCGVDTRFKPDSLRRMIELMLTKRKTMLSFIPDNVASSSSSMIELLAIQPWRYLWELGLPRRKLNRPPVLSTCWLIDKASLLGNGGFKAVSRNVLPERYFARETIKHNDGYSFIRSDEAVGLSCLKSFEEQYDTAIRTRYPILRQRLELASLVSLLEVIVLVLPILLVIIELIDGGWLLAAISSVNFIIVSYCFYKVASLTYQKSMPLSLVLMPLLAIYDIYLLLFSMWQYEFNEVVWKGRNVCIPVMHVVPNLPPLVNKHR